MPGSNGAPTFPRLLRQGAWTKTKVLARTWARPLWPPILTRRTEASCTYTLSDDTNFSINTSGQLKTKVPLDHEDNRDHQRHGHGHRPIRCFWDTGTVIVTVTVNDVNEAPTIDTGPTRAP